MHGSVDMYNYMVSLLPAIGGMVLQQLVRVHLRRKSKQNVKQNVRYKKFQSETLVDQPNVAVFFVFEPTYYGSRLLCLKRTFLHSHSGSLLNNLTNDSQLE